MLFHVISTPFLGNFPNWPPIMVTPIPLYFLFFSSGSGNMCTYFNTTLNGALPQICNVIRALSPFLGRPLKARETCVRINHTPFFLISRESSKKKHPISRGDWFENTPFPSFFFQRQTAKNTSFPEKVGMRMRLPCTFEWGWWGRGATSLVYRRFLMSYSLTMNKSSLCKTPTPPPGLATVSDSILIACSALGKAFYFFLVPRRGLSLILTCNHIAF